MFSLLTIAQCLMFIFRTLRGAHRGRLNWRILSFIAIDWDSGSLSGSGIEIALYLLRIPFELHSVASVRFANGAIQRLL